MNEEKRTPRGVLNSIAIVVAVALFFAGYHIGNGANERPFFAVPADGSFASADFDPFWRTWRLLEEKFVTTASSTNTTPQEKIWGAIQGLTDSYGDPYTVFLPPRENEAFESSINGSFSGVGMEIGEREGLLTVIAPLKGTPAEAAGVLSGDIIMQIDGRSTQGMSIDDAVEEIRGEKGTEVELTLLRRGEGEPIEVTIVRDTIVVPTTDRFLDESGAYVIELYNFAAPSTADFRQALRDFQSSGAEDLILDLRGNPGGYLESAVEIASYFLPAGKVVVIENFGEGKDNVVHRSKGFEFIDPNTDIVVLVDEGSASASEILAGALQEHGVAPLVGEQTFGKGSVQELVPITRDTSLKVTIARWLTPLGTSISEGGLTPDEIVELTVDDIEADRDPQFDRAVEILLEN